MWTSKSLRHTTKFRTVCLGDKGSMISNLHNDVKKQFSDMVQTVKEIIKNISLTEQGLDFKKAHKVPKHNKVIIITAINPL